MKIEITAYGALVITRMRRGKEVDNLMQCPFVSENATDKKGQSILRYCGDWCAHFGEPEHLKIINPYGNNHNITELKLCHGKTLTGIITDKRLIENPED